MTRVRHRGDGYEGRLDERVTACDGEPLAWVEWDGAPPRYPALVPWRELEVVEDALALPAGKG